MAPKRKRTSLQTSPRKKTNRSGRPRKSEVNYNEPSSEDLGPFYRVRNILDENAKQYKVDWEDGPHGEQYPPTWEPKDFVNEVAIEDWENIKKKRGKSGKERVQSTTPQSSPQPKKRGRGRPRKNTVPAPDSGDVARSLVTSPSPADQESEAAGPPPVSTPRPAPCSSDRLLEIPDSHPGNRQQNSPSLDHVASSPERVTPKANRLQSKSRSATSIEVHISPRKRTEGEDYLDFTSSQVISGTQPQPEDSAPDSSRSYPVDAAAAPNLTQKHSQYEPEDTSRSEYTGPSAPITSSSGVHTFSNYHQYPSGTVIPDSQSLNDSLSYVPSQNKSRESDQTNGSEVLPLPATKTQDLHTPYSQTVPESSILQRPEPQEADDALPQDTTTISGEVESWTADGLPEPPSSPVEDDAVDGAQVPESPESSASISSSTSSPPPTESPDKSQSQTHSQSQPLQLHTGLGIQKGVKDVVTQPFPFDVAGTEIIVTSIGGDNPVGSIISDRIENVAETPHSVPAVSVPSQHLDSDSSIRFNTQCFPPANHQELDSSPIPSVPSQSIVNIGLSAPSLLRPSLLGALQTPEPATEMSELPATPMTPMERKKAELIEKMSTARVANRAKSAANTVTPKPASAIPPRLQEDREVRSPSMIPAVEALTKETPEEYFRSERYETLLPGDEPESHDFGIFNPTQSAPKSESIHNVRSIPINFGEMQRDDYKNLLTYRKTFIDEFTSKVWPADSSLAHTARKLIQELRCLALHPDLVNRETDTQRSPVPPEFQAQWDADSSTKFRFLKLFFAAAQQYNLSAALLVQPGRIVNMLQTHFIGTGVEFATISDTSPQPESRCPATIITTDLESVNAPTPDLILCLQGEISDQTIKKYQMLLSRGDSLVPAFSLIVPKTVEHIERSMSPYDSEATSLHVLVGTIMTLKSEAGRDRDIGNGNDSIGSAASDLVEFCLNPTEWPFDELPDIRLFDPMTPSQASTDSSLNGNSAKRPLDAGSEVQQGPKKAKTGLSSLELENAGSQDVDVSHISDSVASQQAAIIKSLKDERDAFARQAKEMELAIRKAQGQVQEHVRALETLQYDHEEQRDKLLQKETELDRVVAKAQADALRFTSLETRYNEMREERTELQRQLREAKEALLNQAEPERAEFERMKEEAAAATAERTKLLNKVKQAEENYDYLRDQYQTASNMASQLGTANKALEAENAELAKKASGEQLRVREKTLDSSAKGVMNRVRLLELTIKSREELLLRKEEEITKIKESRGRMNTRGSSVPRTPRLGSPLAQGTSSRQASPAGKGPHPLRNAG